MIGTDEFATAMQQLSAEAEKVLTASEPAHGAAEEGALAQEMRSLNARLENLEQTLTSKIDNLTKGNGGAKQPAFTDHLRLIEDQLAELVSRDGTTQKLFDSLHAELLNYRDNFIHESLQRPFIHDLVLLFDDLTGLAKQLETASEEKKRGQVARWRDNLQNAIHALV